MTIDGYWRLTAVAEVSMDNQQCSGKQISHSDHQGLTRSARDDENFLSNIIKKN